MTHLLRFKEVAAHKLGHRSWQYTYWGSEAFFPGSFSTCSCIYRGVSLSSCISGKLPLATILSGLIWLTCWTFSLKPSLHIKPSIPTFSLPPSTQQYLKTYLGAPGDSLSPTTSWFPQHQSQCLCLKEQDPVRAPWLLHHHSHLHVHLQRRWKVSGREPVKSQQPSHTIWDLGFWWAGHFLGYQAGQHDSSFCRKELPSLNTFCYLFGAMVLGWAWVGSICSLRVL